MVHSIADSRWCIVIADDPGPEWAGEGINRSHRPVQFTRLGESATLFQRALHRAATLAPASRVMLTLAEQHRSEWEPSSWFVRPEQRFVAQSRAGAPVTLATAILRVASHSVSNIITILPARCAVVQEGVLRRALSYATEELGRVPQGVAGLGMIDLEEPIDEDYLLVARSRAGAGLEVQGVARRPVPWVARHLREHGALVASGILVGYAGALAAHISRVWPGLSSGLAELGAAAEGVGTECKIPLEIFRDVPSAVLRSLRFQPPSLPQRVFGVARSGWCGLKSPRAVARLAAFHAYAKHCVVEGSAAPPHARRLPSGEFDGLMAGH